jgi:hypothetical protein
VSGESVILPIQSLSVRRGIQQTILTCNFFLLKKQLNYFVHIYTHTQAIWKKGPHKVISNAPPCLLALSVCVCVVCTCAKTINQAATFFLKAAPILFCKMLKFTDNRQRNTLFYKRDEWIRWIYLNSVDLCQKFSK